MIMGISALNMRIFLEMLLFSVKKWGEMSVVGYELRVTGCGLQVSGFARHSP